MIRALLLLGLVVGLSGCVSRAQYKRDIAMSLKLHESSVNAHNVTANLLMDMARRIVALEEQARDLNAMTEQEFEAEINNGGKKR